METTTLYHLFPQAQGGSSSITHSGVQGREGLPGKFALGFQLHFPQRPDFSRSADDFTVSWHKWSHQEEWGALPIPLGISAK